MTEYTSTNAPLAALGMAAADINSLSVSQKTGIIRLLDNINGGLHKTNNIPTTGTGVSTTAATSEGAWRPTSGNTLAAAYEGMNEKIMHMVTTFVLQDQNWLTAIATNVDARTGGLSWSFTEFSPKVPNQVPARSRVRLLSMRKGSGTAKMTRKGIGAEFDLETLEAGVPDGPATFIEQLSNINLSVSEGLRIDLMWQIMTAMLTHPVHINDKVMAQLQVRGLLDLTNRMVFSAISNPKCVQLWLDHFKTRQRMMGVSQEGEQHVWIMNYHTALRLHNDNLLVQKYQLQDMLQNPFRVDAASAWSNFMGEDIFLARPFYNVDGEYDPMRMQSRIGLDYTFVDTSRIWPEKPWSPDANIMNVPDLERGSYFAIDYPQLIHNCGRFDAGTGDALSISAYKSWGAVTPDQFKSIRPDSDQFHPEGSDDAAFVIGSAPGFTGGRALSIVGTFLKAHPELANKLNSLIARVEEVAGFMEAAIPSAKLFAAIAALPNAQNLQAGGIRPVDDQLFQAQQAPALRFVTPEKDLVAETVQTNYPAFFASGGGFSFLAANGTDATKPIYAEIIKDAREIASQLSGLSDTLALNPAYSANGIFNSDPAVLLIDAILPMRPNLFVPKAGMANADSQLKDAAEGYLASLARYKTLPLVDNNNAQRAFVAYSILHKFQATHQLKERTEGARIAAISDDVKAIVEKVTPPENTAAAMITLLSQHTTVESLPKPAEVLAALKKQVDAGVGGVDRETLFRTPFRVAPTQLKDVKAAGMTVQRIGEFDQPAQKAELDEYIAAASDADPMKKYAHGFPIGRRGMIFGKESVRTADAATRALLPRASPLMSSALASTFVPAPSVQSLVMNLWAGADTSAAASAAAISNTKLRTAAFAMSGVADARAADIVTQEYVRTFNDIGRMAVTDAHAVLARIFMTLRLNANALIAAYRAGFPPVLEFHNLTVLEVDSYPVIRLPPGKRTLIWAQTHEMLNWGTNSQTGMLGIYLTYYTGTASPEPQRVQGIECVDPIAHRKGSAGRFVSSRLFPTDANDGGLLPVAYFAPDNYTLGDHYFSLTGGVALGNSAVSLDALELSNGISRFEMIRTGANSHNGHKPATIQPPVTLGVITQAAATTSYFTRSSSSFGNDCVLESHSPIPTAFHNSRCRANLFEVITENTFNARVLGTK